VRSRIRGAAGQPRLCVYRSNRHVYAQIVDDTEGCTLATASTLSPEFRNVDEKKAGKDAAFVVGQMIATRGLEKGVERVVFDRNGFIYHKNGLIASLANGARKGGLKF